MIQGKLIFSGTSVGSFDDFNHSKFIRMLTSDHSLFLGPTFKTNELAEHRQKGAKSIYEIEVELDVVMEKTDPDNIEKLRESGHVGPIGNRVAIDDTQVNIMIGALRTISYWCGTGNAEAQRLSKIAYDAMQQVGGRL